jgi:hypothetical protein
MKIDEPAARALLTPVVEERAEEPEIVVPSIEALYAEFYRRNADHGIFA